MVQYIENEFEDNFCRPQTITTTPGVNGWTLTDTSAAGSPTMLVASGVGLQISLAANNEIENLCLSHGDVLCFPATRLQRVEFVIGVTAFAAADTLTFGMASARNDAVASITSFAGFRVLGSGSLTNVLIDCRDGVLTANTQSGVSAIGPSGQATMTADEKLFAIDFTNGIGDIRYEVNGERVAAGTQFSLSGLTSSSFLQPYVQLQKTASTDVPVATIRRVHIVHNFFFGGVISLDRSG